MRRICRRRPRSCPRWLHVLPNGDVLVAETNRPPEQGRRFQSDGQIVQSAAQKIAGAASGQERQQDQAVARRRRRWKGRNERYSSGAEFAVRNDARRRHALRRRHRRDGRFPLSAGRDQDLSTRPQEFADLPAGPINLHWTKDVIASLDGKRLLCHRRVQQQCRRGGHGK